MELVGQPGAQYLLNHVGPADHLHHRVPSTGLSLR
jgi:hypothetical protein